MSENIYKTCNRKFKFKKIIQNFNLAILKRFESRDAGLSMDRLINIDNILNNYYYITLSINKLYVKFIKKNNLTYIA